MSPQKTENGDVNMNDIPLAPPTNNNFGADQFKREAAAQDVFAIAAPTRIAGDAYLVIQKDAEGRHVGHTNGTLDRPLTGGELKQAARYYKDHNGNYLPPAIARQRIPTPDHLDRENEADKLKIRDYKRLEWQKKNADLGIASLETFWEKDKAAYTKSGKLKAEFENLKTDHGIRQVTEKYEKPFQAGSETSDITIIKGDGSVIFYNRRPGDSFAGKSYGEFEVAMKKMHGNDAEIYLKSASGILHKPSYIEQFEPGGADRRFRAFAEEYIQHNRDLPRITVNIGGKNGIPDFHVGLDALRTMKDPNAQNWVKALERGEEWDKVHMLTPDGNGYRTLNRMHSSSKKEYYKEEMEKAGLPETMGALSHGKRVKFERYDQNAPVTVQFGPGLKDVKDVDYSQLPSIETKHFMLADRNEDGQRTGTYTSLAEYERQKKVLPLDAAADLRLSPDIYSSTFVKPERAYDNRPPAGRSAQSL